jgi:DNA-binding CsgD family transcriptional regulator
MGTSPRSSCSAGPSRADRRPQRPHRTPSLCHGTTIPECDSPSERVQLITDRRSKLAVLKLVAKGKSNADIAAELYLNEPTVNTYVSRLLTKLDLRDRVQLAVLAYESGLVQVGEASTRTRPNRQIEADHDAATVAEDPAIIDASTYSPRRARS